MRRTHAVPTRTLSAALVLLGACGGAPARETPAPVPTPPRTVAKVEAPPPAPAPCGVPAFEPEVVREAPGATLLTSDDRDVFWSDGSEVWSAPVEGGEPRKLLRGQGAMPIRKLRVVGERLFVQQRSETTGRKCQGRVAWAPRDGGELHPVGDPGCIDDFDVRGEWVVYTTIGYEPDGGMMGSLWKAKVESGPSSDLFNLFNGTSQVVTDGREAWVGLAIGQMHRVALRNGAAEVVDEGFRGRFADDVWHSYLAVDEQAFYFPVGHTNLKGAKLYRLRKEPGAEPLELGRMFPPIDGSRGWPQSYLLQTATHLYWASTPEGRVLRVTKDGHCPVEEIATSRKRPDFATPAGKWTFWIDLGEEKHMIVRRRVEP